MFSKPIGWGFTGKWTNKALISVIEYIFGSQYVFLYFHYCFVFRKTIKIARLWQNIPKIIPITCKRSNNEIQFWINKLLWQRKFYWKNYSTENCVRIEINRGSAKALRPKASDECRELLRTNSLTYTWTNLKVLNKCSFHL